MDMKEFSHTNDLIENAEEWMTRVKDMLESGEPTTLQALEALLIEAEGIPVQMEEQQLLTVGIKSRQWRIRVDATLAAGKSKLHSLQDLATEVRVVMVWCRFSVSGTASVSICLPLVLGSSVPFSTVIILSCQIDDRPTRVLLDCTLFSFLFTIVDARHTMRLSLSGRNAAGGIPQGCQEPPGVCLSRREQVASPHQAGKGVDDQGEELHSIHANWACDVCRSPSQLAGGGEVNQS